MDRIKFHLSKKKNSIVEDINIDNKTIKTNINKGKNENLNSIQTEISSKDEYSNRRNIILKNIKISDDSKKLKRKTINKNNIYDLGDLISNLKTIKLNNLNINKKKNEIHSIDKINKKSIDKDKDYNDSIFYLSCKTFNFNNNKSNSSNKQNINYENKILNKNVHDLHNIRRNIENFESENVLNKFNKNKIINKNIQKNNININLNINNILNFQNIETIDINKINPNQKLIFVKNDILHSYINFGKVYRDKISLSLPKEKQFNTLENYSHEKRSTKYINNNKTNRNIFYSTNIKIKNKNNSMRDNLFKKTNNETNYMNRGNYNKKNIKLNDNILINRTNDHINNINNYLPKFSSINNSNTNIRDNYNSNIEFSREFIDNKTINNKSIRNTNMNKNYYFRVLTNKKKKLIFGDTFKKENKLNNQNILDGNINLKLSKSKNKDEHSPKTLLYIDKNSIVNYNNFNHNHKINKPKNYFNYKITKLDKQKKLNNNFYTLKAKDNNNNAIKMKNMNGNKNDESIFLNSRPEYVKEYNDEILINLLIEEYIFNKRKKLILNSEILNNYGINPAIRACLIDSLIGLQQTFKFCDKTLFITIQIFDNYIGEIISSNDKSLHVDETDLDIIIVACFLIASKMEESFIYHLTDYLSILSDKYTTEHLMNMEYNILKHYNFEAFEPNILDFFEIFSSLCDLDDDSKKKGILILHISLLNIDILQMPSSIVAFSVLYLMMKKDFITISNKIDNLFYNLYKWSDWNKKNFGDKEKNETYSKYMKLISPLKKENNIKEIANMILYFVENLPKDEFSNIAKRIENKIDSFLNNNN